MRLGRMFSMGIIFYVVCTTLAYGEIYKYIDDNGQACFVNRISVIPQKYRDSAQILTEFKTDKYIKEATQQDFSLRARNKVEVYVTAWCPYCTKLENFLKRNNVRYQRYDIEKSEEARKKYRALGGRGVPLTKVGTQVIRGYDPKKILSTYNSL